MDNLEIEDILRFWQERKKQTICPETIFGVLGRAYDEDLLSRLILKCLKDDPKAVVALLRYYGYNEFNVDGLVIDNAKCEQVTKGLSRIDIFMEGRNALNQKFVLAIENKVSSWEHDDQTKTYCEWIETNYQGEAEALCCIYLKPSCNFSTPSSQAFHVLTYRQFQAMFKEDNKFINELKEHIDLYLEAPPMKAMDPLIIEHYSELKEIVDQIEANWKKLADAVEEEFLASLPKGTLKQNHSTGRRIYRYYDESAGWFKKNSYYFYIEFKLGNNDKLEDICVQQALHVYSDTPEAVTTFIQKEEGFSQDVHSYWARKENIEPESSIFSEPWFEETKQRLVIKLKEAYRKQIELFNRFKAEVGLLS